MTLRAIYPPKAGGVVGPGGGVAISAGAEEVTAGTVIFSNASGVSFGLNASTLTASVKTDYLTTAMASNRGSDFVQATAGFAGTSCSGTIASNGISVNVGPYITTAALSNHSHGVSFTSGSVGFQTLSFTNSNGISFNSGTQGIFASHNAITTARASTDAIGLNTAKSNVTWTVDSSGLSLDARGYAGTGTSATNASITLDSNGLAISVAAPGGGAAINRSFHEIIEGERVTRCATLTATQWTKRPIFVPFWLDGENLSVKTVRLMVERTVGTSLNMTWGAGFYTMVNSTSLALVSSTTNAISLTASGQYSGVRALDLTGLGAFTLSEGRWWMALYFSASNNATGNNPLILWGADPFPAVVGFMSAGTDSTAATNASSGYFPFWGAYSATSAGFPANVGKSDMSMSGPNNLLDPYAVLMEVS